MPRREVERGSDTPPEKPAGSGERRRMRCRQREDGESSNSFGWREDEALEKEEKIMGE